MYAFMCMYICHAYIPCCEAPICLHKKTNRSTSTLSPCMYTHIYSHFFNTHFRAACTCSRRIEAQRQSLRCTLPYIHTSLHENIQFVLPLGLYLHSPTGNLNTQTYTYMFIFTRLGLCQMDLKCSNNVCAILMYMRTYTHAYTISNV
jgi:hypothetical protein